MLKPKIYRTSENSSGEKIVEMIASRLRRLSYNMKITKRGDEVYIKTQSDPIAMNTYFYPSNKKREIKALIRAL